MLECMIDYGLVLGCMDVICQFCKARKWRGERPGLCCMNGKIAIPLNDLLSGHPEQDANHFLKNIRRYNSAFLSLSLLNHSSCRILPVSICVCVCERERER